MRQALLDIQKVEVLAFDPKTITAKLSITFLNNNVPNKLERSFVLDNPEAMKETIIRDVKAEGKISPSEEDDILGSLFVVSLLREDDIEERLIMNLSKLCEKARMLKHMRNHLDYMKLFDEIKIVKFSV